MREANKISIINVFYWCITETRAERLCKLSVKEMKHLNEYCRIYLNELALN